MSQLCKKYGYLILVLGVALIGARQNIGFVVHAVRWTAKQGPYVAYVGLAVMSVHMLIDWWTDRSGKHST